MERLISVARTLRERERFNGYLHLKTIPGSSDHLVLEAARWADRVSVNIELPSAASLARIAPDKTPAAIFGPMKTLARAGGYEPRRLIGNTDSTGSIDGPGGSGTAGVRPPLPSPVSRDEFGEPAASETREPQPLYDSAAEPAPSFRPSVRDFRKTVRRDTSAAVLPAGQTTQLVVGASPESDAAILTLAENLYLAYDVRRVYYSAFIPASADPRVPALPGPPLLREHRLYQADWLFRFYGFTAAEILESDVPFLDDVLDPKCDWAIRNIDRFPVDVNAASYAELLRVPGIGPKAASRILRARRACRLQCRQLRALGVVMKRARWFVSCSGALSEDLGAGMLSRAYGDRNALRGILADGAAAALPTPGSGQLLFDWNAAP
jgi:putative DNA modification/repair radical SAM protein